MTEKVISREQQLPILSKLASLYTAPPKISDLKILPNPKRPFFPRIFLHFASLPIRHSAYYPQLLRIKLSYRNLLNRGGEKIKANHAGEKIIGITVISCKIHIWFSRI